MNHQDVFMLIRAHYMNDEKEFRKACWNIAIYFDSIGYESIADYIVALLHPEYDFIPMNEK